MPSNNMYVCLDCRKGGKSLMPACRDHRTLCLGKHITVPKHNNKRAWKRLEKGEIRWDRRKARHFYNPYKFYRKPNMKPGQGWSSALEHSGSRGPNVDLGG